MNWSEMYKPDRQPTSGETSTYIQTPLWQDFKDFIAENYKTEPLVEYSGCGMAPGWNVKYKRNSKALCTLYPQQGFFTCLVVAPEKNSVETELILPLFDVYVQNLYNSTKPFNGGRWLMIDVTSPKILEDVKQLVLLRSKPVKKPIVG